MQNNKTLTFNIQRYSVHDGPGIRTIVFLKGCPLRCPWCANPEGQSFTKDIMHNSNLCQKCGLCIVKCSENALSFDSNNNIKINRNLCNFCGKCKEVCPVDAYKIFGEEKNCEEILKDVIKDETFYSRSGGGVTVSGGEPLSNPEFLLELVKKAKLDYGLNVAIETTAFSSEEVLRSVIEYIDFFLCDIKIVNGIRHKEIMAVSNDDILNNIRIIANEYPNKELVLRMPVVPTFNDDLENIQGIADFIKSLKREIPLELLPYHEFGKGKYTGIGKQYPKSLEGISIPEKEFMEKIEAEFINLGIKIIHT